eukprot:930060-Lingulodinium_polyedra.AAC.1
MRTPFPTPNSDGIWKTKKHRTWEIATGPTPNESEISAIMQWLRNGPGPPPLWETIPGERKT